MMTGTNNQLVRAELVTLHQWLARAVLEARIDEHERTCRTCRGAYDHDSARWIVCHPRGAELRAERQGAQP